jgi:hypothetical protein
MKGKGLFDEDERLVRLIKLGDSLVKIDGHINWEEFCPLLKRALKKERQKNKGGRPPYDDILMFKILRPQLFLFQIFHIPVLQMFRIIVDTLNSDGVAFPMQNVSRYSHVNADNATSHKPQATSHKPQATSHKPQATSHKPQATSHK